MRNLKKILALVLALVMSLSLVTIASGADFTDADEIELTEAVDVMTTIGVFEGHNTGAFAPKGTLTREQAAKIITYMLLGENADKLSVGTSRYSDVAVTRWSAPAIEYCSTLGIVAGNGDGTFNPAGTLTSYAFAKMLLTALGYKSSAEGFTGSTWTVNVARYALEVGLDKGMGGITWGATLTREQAAQMALNAIKAPLVAYDNGATIIIDGEKVSFGSGDAYYVTTTLAKEQRISKRTLSNTKEYTVEFGEKYFPKLELSNDTDDFGRPTYTWTYNKDKIGTYLNTELLEVEYTTKVVGKDLYNDLGASAIKDYTLTVYVDGVTETKVNGKDTGVFTASVLTKTNNTTLGRTGNGVLTQVFVDDDAESITVAIINTYLAKASSDYNTKKDTLALDVYGVYEYRDSFVKDSATYSTSETAYGDDFDIANAKDGDFFLVTVANGAIQSMEAPEVVSNATLKSFKMKESVNSDGETYDYASTVVYHEDVLDQYDDNNMKDTTYNLYLDQYGYMIGIDIVESVKNYVFIAGYESFGSVLTAAKTDALAIFMDGSYKTITVKNAGETIDVDGKVWGTWSGRTGVGNADENGWYTYTTDKDGNYSLTPVASKLNSSNGVKVAQSQDKTNGKAIDKAHVSLSTTNDGYVYGNDDSVYISAKTKTVNGNELISGASAAVTGVKNVKMELAANSSEPDGAYILYNNKGYVLASVVVGRNLAVTDNYAYIIGGVSQEDYDGEADEWTWYRKAIVNGEEVVLKEKGSDLLHLGSGLRSGNVQTYGWYIVSYDADGYVVDTDAVTYDLAGALNSSTDAVQNVTAFNKTNVSGYDKEDVILVYQPMSTGGNQVLTLSGLTLYVTKNMTYDTGISIMPDAKAVLIDEWDGKTDVEYFNSDSGNVKAALDAMQDTAFNGSVYFVMKDGTATTVIIKDNGNHVSEPGKPGQVDGKLTINSMVYNKDTSQFEASVTTSVALAGTEKYTMSITTKDGVSVAKITDATWPYAVGANNTVTVGVRYSAVSGTGDYIVTISFVDASGNAVASGSATLHVA